ncbi:MAG: hypothetical protein RR885_06600 [Oscillospiraceae bacterium]
MEAYEAMYCKLFNGLTDIITALQELQQKTEEMYISFSEQASAKADIERP